MSEVEWRTDWGREFQSWGAVRENALSPKVFSRDIGVVRVRVEEEPQVNLCVLFILIEMCFFFHSASG